MIIRMLAALAAMALAWPAAAQTLTLYTSQPNQDAQQTADAFMAKNPGIKVEFIRDGTPKVIAKLRAEMAAGEVKADLLLIADTVTMEQLKREGKLLAHTGADVAAYDPQLHDKDRTYFSTKLITTGIVYNTSSPVKPTSWKDLLKPELKGRIDMPSPLTSGAAMIHLTTLTEKTELGWAYYEALAKNGAKAVGGNGNVLKSVAGGEKMVGVIVDFMPIREKAKGAPVEFVFPDDGVTWVTEPVAILAGTKNADAAKKFVDFLLSKEGQELALKQGYLPAHPAVAAPAGFPARDKVRLLAFDPAKALDTEEANKKKFSALFGE